MASKLLSLFIFACSGLFSQNPIPNFGFENWSNGNPNGWSTTNLPGWATPIVQSSSSHSGNSAAQLIVVSALTGTIPPYLYLSNAASISQDYQTFSFYYKGVLGGGDELVSIVSIKNSSTTIAMGIANLSNINSSVYTQTILPLFYTGSGASAIDISFLISNPTSTTTSVGSNATIDDLALGASVGLQSISTMPEFGLGQIYPNPMNTEGLIPFSISKAALVELEIYTPEGKRVLDVLRAELGSGNYKAELNVSTLPSGLYFCKLSSEGRSLYSKLFVN